jgi:hypothetical protein
LSEIVTFEAPAIDMVDAQSSAPERAVPDYIDPELDDSALTDLVSQNANELVVLHGVEMTLSEAMYQEKKTVSDIKSSLEVQSRASVRVPPAIAESSINSADKTDASASSIEPVASVAEVSHTADESHVPSSVAETSFEGAGRESIADDKIVTNYEIIQKAETSIAELIADDNAEVYYGEMETTELEPEPEIPAFEISPDSLTEFSEEEIWVDHSEPGDLLIPVSDRELSDSIERNEMLIFSNFESPVLENITTAEPERDKLSLSINEVEETLVLLSERLEDAEPEIEEVLNEILDKVIEMPARLENRDENDITEAEAVEELEELFIQLMDYLGIDYTPELIESLVSVALRQQLIELENPKDYIDSAPSEYGTHEAIIKLLYGVSVIKKAQTHAGVIGKSALHLYRFQLLV